MAEAGQVFGRRKNPLQHLNVPMYLRIMSSNRPMFLGEARMSTDDQDLAL